MKIYFDASVIIAALLSSTGGSSQLFKYIKTGLITGITSLTAIDEIMEKEKFDKFHKTRKEIEQFILSLGLIIQEHINSDEIRPFQNQVDKEDAHLIVGAIQTKCQYLVTLDRKHLLRKDIKDKFLPLKIVSPKELLEEIIKRN